MSALLTPHLSEKSYALAKNANVYVFEVVKSLNKVQIKALLEEEYQVTVVGLRTLVAKGKQARSLSFNRRRANRRVMGRRTTVKKAYVTLKTGDSIAVFAESKS